MSAVPVVSLGCRLEMYLEREVVICWLLIPRETAGKCSWIAALTLLVSTYATVRSDMLNRLNILHMVVIYSGSCSLDPKLSLHFSYCKQ